MKKRFISYECYCGTVDAISHADFTAMVTDTACIFDTLHDHAKQTHGPEIAEVAEFVWQDAETKESAIARHTVEFDIWEKSL